MNHQIHRCIEVTIRVTVCLLSCNSKFTGTLTFISVVTDTGALAKAYFKTKDCYFEPVEKVFGYDYKTGKPNCLQIFSNTFNIKSFAAARQDVSMYIQGTLTGFIQQHSSDLNVFDNFYIPYQTLSQQGTKSDVSLLSLKPFSGLVLLHNFFLQKKTMTL